MSNEVLTGGRRRLWISLSRSFRWCGLQHWYHSGGTSNRFRLVLSTYPMMPHCGSAQHLGSLELMQLLQSCQGRLSALVARLVSSGGRPVRTVKFRMTYSVWIIQSLEICSKKYGVKKNFFLKWTPSLCLKFTKELWKLSACCCSFWDQGHDHPCLFYWRAAQVLCICLASC